MVSGTHTWVGLYERSNFPNIEEYAPHLKEDKVTQFVDKYMLAWMGLALLIPVLVGGWTGLVWAGGVRIFLTTHVTWSVNSICHTFGRRELRDDR